jgi:tryptophan halogenase
MPADKAVRDLVVVGGGLAGWYCAARLCHAMRGRRVRVRVVHAAPRGAEPDALDVFCASTLPTLALGHAELGIEERDFMRACEATFKLATEYRGFGDAGRSYLWPFGEFGASLEGAGFHQWLIRLMQSGRDLDVDEFSVPAIAARLGRFAHPSPDERSVLSTYEYGYHLDTKAYTRLLRAAALRLGAEAVDEDLATVVGDAQRIESLTLGDGTRLRGDFYVDCTGPRAALLAGALGTPFESWATWLPCSGALHLRGKALDTVPPYTRVTAQPGGWLLQVPLRTSVDQLLVFDRQRIDARAAARAAGSGEPTELQFTNGRLRESWRGNCVAVGAAAGVLEPLAGTALRLVDEGITRLVALFPDGGDNTRLAAEYNRTLAAVYGGARDFVLLRYLHRARHLPVPDSMARRVEQFRYRGRVVLLDHEWFDETDWACSWLGQGERPAHHSILTGQLSEADALGQVAKIARLMHSAAQQLPPHQAYLDRYLA